jgi:hypothetical protein
MVYKHGYVGKRKKIIALIVLFKKMNLTDFTLRLALFSLFIFKIAVLNNNKYHKHDIV